VRDEDVYLGAYWKDRRLSAREYIQLCYDFLQRLEALSPAFANRCVVIREEPARVPKDHSGFEQTILRCLAEGDHVYVNPDPGVKSLTLDSTIRVGFLTSFSDPDPKATRDTAIGIRVAAGGHGGRYSPPNHVLIEIPAGHRELWTEKRTARDLMNIVVATWHPTFAVLSSTELKKALDPNKVNNHTVGPFTYFAQRAAENAVSGGIASVSDITGAGPLITIDAPEPWAAHVQQFKPVYDRLSAANLLKWQHEQAA